MGQLQVFDAVASTYDADFTQSPVARYLRGRVHQRLGQHFRAGDRVLELGCGTGEDALWLAEQGAHVLATDSSAAMLDITRAKTVSYPQVQTEKLDLIVLPDPSRRPVFDGAFSNFGPLNVLHDWQPLATWLAQCVKPGGVVAFGVMGPVCLWEIGWHSLHGDWKTATRRLRGRARYQPPGAAEVLMIAYPSIGRLKADFAPYFCCTRVESLGLFLPPGDVYGVVERHPCLLRGLMALEERFGRSALLARFADHYWIEFERGNQ